MRTSSNACLCSPYSNLLFVQLVNLRFASKVEGPRDLQLERTVGTCLNAGNGECDAALQCFGTGTECLLLTKGRLAETSFFQRPIFLQRPDVQDTSELLVTVTIWYGRLNSFFGVCRFSQAMPARLSKSSSQTAQQQISSLFKNLLMSHVCVRSSTQSAVEGLLFKAKLNIHQLRLPIYKPVVDDLIWVAGGRGLHVNSYCTDYDKGLAYSAIRYISVALYSDIALVSKRQSLFVTYRLYDFTFVCPTTIAQNLTYTLLQYALNCTDLT